MKKQLLLTTLAILTASFFLRAQVAPSIFAEDMGPGLIGLNFDSQGNLWSTRDGSGNDDGQITILDPQGNKTVFMTGLPSTYIQATGEVVGSYRTYQLPDNKVLVVVGEGAHDLSETLLVVDKSDFTSGSPLTLADVEQVYDVGGFSRGLGFVNSNPFNVDWDVDGNIYISDSGANSIIKRDKNTGEFTIVKTLDGIPNPLPFGPPVIDPVPTKVLRKPDGTFHISQLTGFPFVQGVSKIFNLDAEGNLSVHAEGFTCVTDMSFDPTDGNLCVMQFGVFGPVDSTLNFILGTAAVIKLLPDGTRDTIAQGISGLAPSFAFDASGDLYVADLVFGQILKYDFLTATEEPIVAKSKVKAFPNPFAEQVIFEYELTQSAVVSAEIFDLSGRKIAAFNEGNQGAGVHTFNWDGKDGNGLKVAAGAYVYRLVVDKQLLSGVINLTK